MAGTSTRPQPLQEKEEVPLNLNMNMTISLSKPAADQCSPEKCVYLDYNGTTPIHPSVLEAMLPYLQQHFGNPSSSHHYGQEPKRAVKKARLSLMRLIQSHAPIVESVIYTGCGTESNNLAIRLALLSSLHKSDNGLLHVVTTNIEHPAISECLKAYSSGGWTPKITVAYIPVDKEGLVSAKEVIAAIQPNTALVTIMTANNEVGSIQPVFEIAKICREKHVLFHTDAAQAVGKIDLRGIADTTHGADLVTLVGHKFGAPKGIAALYIRPNCFDESERTNPENGGSILLMGGGQEGGRRGGTENVPYIVGMGRAAELLLQQRPNPMQEGSVSEGWQNNKAHMEQMREHLLSLLVNGLGKENVRTNGPLDATKRLPNTLSVGLKGVQSGALLANIGDMVACSAGSACHSTSSSTASYSSVLKAMDVPPEDAIGTLRLSVGPGTTIEEVEFAANVIVKEARKQLGLS